MYHVIVCVVWQPNNFMLGNLISTYWHWLELSHSTYICHILSLDLIFPSICISQDIFDWPHLKIDNATHHTVVIRLVFRLLQAPLLLCVIVLHHCRVFSLQLHVCTSHTCHLIHKTGAWGSPHWLTASSATLHAATSYPMKTYNVFSDSASHLHTHWHTEPPHKHI